MSNLTTGFSRSIPLFEPLLDRIGDRNPQLMRELRGQLKLGSLLGTVGGAIALNCALGYLTHLITESGGEGMKVWLQCLMVCQGLSILIACNRLTDNLAIEVQQGTINPLRLSPQSAGQILRGKALGIPVFEYLFNLLCLPVYMVVSLAADVPINAIGLSLIGSCNQMALWLSLSMVLGLALRQSKNFTAFISTIVVLVGLGIQTTYGFLLPGVLGFVVPLAASYIFWNCAKTQFRIDKATQSAASAQWTASPMQSGQLAAPKPKSTATPAKAIRFLEPIFDRIGDWNPQLMRELRSRLTSRAVPTILLLSIVLQVFMVAYNIDWLSGSLWSWAIVISCYQLIRNWTIEEEQGTFNPIRLSPQSAGQLLWGKLLGVPSPVYLFSLSCLPLSLMFSLSQGMPIGTILCNLVAGLTQLGFWSTASLLFASLTAKTPGSKAILGAIIVGLSICLQNLIVSGFVSAFVSSNPAAWLSFSIWFVCCLLLPLAGSTLCGQAIVRRFHRPSATLWSKGQTYAVTAIATLCILPFGLEGLPILPYLLLIQGLLLIQPRQVLFDWARRPLAQLSAAPTLGLPAVQRRDVQRRDVQRDLIWGESSPPLLAMGVHLGIVAAGVGVYSLWNIASIGSVVSQNAMTLTASLLLANLMVLSIGLTQLLQLNLRQKAASQSLLFAIAILGLPLFGVVLINGSSPLWLLTLYPWAALAAQPPGYAIAALCLQWTGIVVVYRLFDRNLSRLAKSDFARALEPVPTPRQES
jgi:hypothetical protein